MIKAARLLAALLASTTLTACGTVPQTIPFAAEPSQAKNVNPIEAVKPAQARGQDWWRGTGDPQLTAIMAQALDNSPSLAIAAARLNQSEAAVSQYRASAAPKVNLNGAAFEAKQSANFLYPPGDYTSSYLDYGQTTLNFTWELDFWGKNRAAVAAAVSNSRAAEADAAQARLILSTSLANAYIDLDRLYQNHDLAERAVAIRQDSAKLVSQKLLNGISNQAQNQLAKAAVFAAQSDLAAIDEQIALSKHLIAMLAGASPDFAETIKRPALSEVVAAFSGAPSHINLDLIGRRPDIIAARWRAEAASNHIKQAHAAFYPNINLAAFAGYQALGMDRLFAQNSEFGQVGPALSLPLFDGGALKANLKSAEGEHALAIANYNHDVLQAMQQVADTLSSQQALKSRLDTSQQALSAYEESYRLTKLRYDGGLTDYTTLLVAEQSLLAQRRIVTDLQSRGRSLDITLIKSLGGDYAPIQTASH